MTYPELVMLWVSVVLGILTFVQVLASCAALVLWLDDRKHGREVAVMWAVSFAMTLAERRGQA